MLLQSREVDSRLMENSHKILGGHLLGFQKIAFFCALFGFSTNKIPLDDKTFDNYIYT